MALHRLFTPAAPESTSNQAENKENTDVFKILVVDDTDVIRRIIIRQLTLHLQNLKVPYDISEAINGKIAVDRVEDTLRSANTDFDIIIMDCEMPELKGPDATQQIRSRENKLRTDEKSYIVTCSTGWKEPYEGADAVLAKQPLDLSGLRHVVDERLHFKEERLHHSLRAVSCA